MSKQKTGAGCRPLFVRLALGLVTVVSLLLIAGFVYETLMLSGDAERYPPPGDLIRINGYDMHLHCVGEGSPTVVFIGGAGALSYQDAAIQQRIRTAARTCIYDRAGYLWSDARPEPRTAWQIIEELHILLNAANVAPPYVLVGSSNGGLYARAFAYQYPDEVAGLVMVDARLETLLGQGGTFPVWVFQSMGRVGFFRVFPDIICPTNACDPEYREEIAVFRGYASNLATYDREIAEGLDGSTEQTALLKERIGGAGVLQDVPLVILQANQSGQPVEQMDARYRAFIEDYREHYTRLSTQSRYVLVNSGHGIAVEQPQLVTESILAVVDTVKTGSRLSP